MAREDNLTPWQPGQSGNPGGFSKKRRFSAALEKLLEEEGGEAFLRAGWQAAKNGDFNFWKYIYERHEGKIPEAEPSDAVSVEELGRRMQARKAKKEFK